jgi:hypothetical protein
VRENLVRIALCGAWLLTASLASAQSGDETPQAPKVDPRARPGPPIVYAERPGARGLTRACSFEVPVCVRAPPSTSGPLILAVLSSTERAWRSLTGPLDLPAPDPDPDTLTYDVWIQPGASELASTWLAARDLRARFDRARAFSVVDAAARPGCALDAAITRAVARAILYRVGPATDEGVARAQVASLADLVVPCALALDADAIEAFQSRPERAACDARALDIPPLPDAVPSRASALYSRGAALFWSRIDWAYGRTPGGLVRATWALAPTTTPEGAKDWNDEPDAFDVLRSTFKGALFTGSTLADLMLDTAVARAFVGSADDGLHQPEARALGDAARVPLDWDLPWPAAPRRVAPRAPVAPSGASYLAIRTSGAPKGARLRAEITWEEHALFRWVFVKVDKAGRELGRIPIAAPERATEAQMTLVGLEGVDRVLLVGVNAGDPAYAFDPDEAVWEPHGWLVTLASE